MPIKSSLKKIMTYSLRLFPLHFAVFCIYRYNFYTSPDHFLPFFLVYFTTHRLSDSGSQMESKLTKPAVLHTEVSYKLQMIIICNRNALTVLTINQGMGCHISGCIWPLWVVLQISEHLSKHKGDEGDEYLILKDTFSVACSFKTG